MADDTIISRTAIIAIIVMIIIACIVSAALNLEGWLMRKIDKETVLLRRQLDDENMLNMNDNDNDNNSENGNEKNENSVNGV